MLTDLLCDLLENIFGPKTTFKNLNFSASIHLCLHVEQAKLFPYVTQHALPWFEPVVKK